MLPFKNSLALIVATRDRPEEMASLLRSLDRQSCPADQIVIVDSGSRSIKTALDIYQASPLVHIHYSPPSASGQRNQGLKYVRAGMTLTGFVDDDVVMESGSIERMMAFWENAPADLGGAAFNLANHPALYAPRMKGSSLAKRLGLYSDERGRVLSSGFQTMIGRVSQNCHTDWLPSTASVWRISLFETIRFDEWFQGYSYLEDLDFSYRVGKAFRLAVVADARCFHYPASSGRGSGLVFGRREVQNRLYFVSKNRELSKAQCLMTLLARTAMSLFLSVRKRKRAYLDRAAGNFLELLGIGSRSETRSPTRISDVD
jgi:GT2 family glycosyltransferase